MRFEYIVLLIIAFNVASAVLQRRAKKAREKSGGNAPASDHETGPAESREPLRGRFEEIESGDRASARRREAAGRAEAGEASRGRKAGRRNRNRPSGEATSTERVEKLPSLGRDILDQLARDLGLKFPEPGKDPEAVRETAPETGGRPPVHREPPEAGPRTLPKRSERPAQGEPRALVRTERMERLPVSPPVPAREEVRGPSLVEAPRVAAGAETLREDLSGARALRRAFVLKEVLDAPLARRRRG